MKQLSFFTYQIQLKLCTYFCTHFTACTNPSKCNGQGTCNTDTTCECNPGYNGPTCSCNDAKTCNGQGTCLPDGTCLCTEAFAGIEDCSSKSLAQGGSGRQICYILFSL